MYVPSDKSVSLSILRVMKENPDGLSYKDLFEKLPYFCRSRIRSVKELREFFGLYKEFHHDCGSFAAKYSSVKTMIEEEIQDDEKCEIMEKDLDNFRMMSPIDIIDKDDLILELFEDPPR